MSSVIELYEHNQKAYDALLDMLGERDRACIIKPTGTGKFERYLCCRKGNRKECRER